VFRSRCSCHVSIAALKCRQRKKAWLAQLQAKVEFLATENERLTSALVSSREEIARLSSLVGAGNGHPQGQIPPLPAGANGTAVPVSMQPGQKGRGYGY
jgi:ATF/CREB family transcription factor